jgi:hypothetical protein
MRTSLTLRVGMGRILVGEEPTALGLTALKAMDVRGRAGPSSRCRNRHLRLEIFENLADSCGNIIRESRNRERFGSFST